MLLIILFSGQTMIIVIIELFEISDYRSGLGVIPYQFFIEKPKNKNI